MVCVIELLGYATALFIVAKLALALFRFIYIFYLGDMLGHTPNYKKLGEWAGKLNVLADHYDISFIEMCMCCYWNYRDAGETSYGCAFINIYNKDN